MIIAGSSCFPAGIKFVINLLLLPEARKTDLYFCSPGFCYTLPLFLVSVKIESNKGTRRICVEKLISSTCDWLRFLLICQDPGLTSEHSLLFRGKLKIHISLPFWISPTLLACLILQRTHILNVNVFLKLGGVGSQCLLFFCCFTYLN